MAGQTYYVSKDGSDLNSGLSWGAAKKTIQAAVNLCPNTNASGADPWLNTPDVVKIRPGVYAEQVNVAGRILNLIAVDYMDEVSARGRVIIDGENLRQYCLICSLMAFSYTRFDGIELRNAQLGLLNNAGGAWYLESYDSEFHNAPWFSTWGLAHRHYRSLFRDFNTTTQQVLGRFDVNRQDYGNLYFYDCTFANGPANQYFLQFSRSYAHFYRNVFVNCPKMVWVDDFDPGSFVQWDNNAFDFASGKIGMGSGLSYTEYTSLASWRAAPSANLGNAHSISITPDDVQDAAKGLWSPTFSSPICTASELGGKIGALYPGIGLSTNRNTAQWDGSTLTNLEQLPNGNLAIVDGQQVGKITTPVIDLGDRYRLYGIRVADVLERYPTDVIDSDITDHPNRHTFEYRYSRLSAGDCAVQTWQTVERCSAGKICFSEAIHARWVQIRITLRTDGIEMGG